MIKTVGCRVLALVAVLTVFLASAWARGSNGAGGKNFLWKVRSNTATVYVLGSIHLAKPDIYPLPKKIEESFASAGILALEADPKQANDPNVLQQMLAAALYPAETTLKEHLSGETYDLASREMEKLGLPIESFARTKPWFLAMSIESLEFLRLGYDPAHGLDMHFAGEAAGKKRILELESFDYQITLMDSFSEREQELFLLYTLKDLAKVREGIEELMTAWRTGDSKKMEGLITRTLSESPEIEPVFDKLFYRRNREMTAKISDLLKGRETVFVVVGAAHLVGKEGIIELLRGKGFRVEQM